MTSASADPSRDFGARDFSARQLFALIFVVCTGFSSQMAMPLWIGAIIDDLALTRSAAGTIASMEFMAVAIVSVLVATQVHRLRARLMVTLGLGLLLLGNLLAAYADTATLLTVCRVLAGCGKGLVVAIVFSLAAGTSRPTRTFALLNAAYALFSMVFYLAIPIFIKLGGAAGAFLMMTGVAVLGLLVLAWFPSRRMSDSAIKNLRFRDIPLFGYIALAALIILWNGHSAVWTFVERLGDRSGLSLAEIGWVLSFSAFLTIGGPTLARLIDTRFGHTAPILAATTTKIAVVCVLVYVPTAWIFTTMVPFFLILALFIVPYIMGILSLADPAGRLAAASSAAMTAGGSLGALAGGWTADGFGYPGLAWVAAISFIVVIALILSIAPRLRQGTTAAPSAAI